MRIWGFWGGFRAGRADYGSGDRAGSVRRLSGPGDGSPGALLPVGLPVPSAPCPVTLWAASAAWMPSMSMSNGLSGCLVSHWSDTAFARPVKLARGWISGSPAIASRRAPAGLHTAGAPPAGAWPAGGCFRCSHLPAFVATQNDQLITFRGSASPGGPRSTRPQGQAVGLDPELAPEMSAWCPPPGPGCRCSASATASRSCARRTCCRAR